MEISISTGLESLPTPRGTFQILRKLQVDICKVLFQIFLMIIMISLECLGQCILHQEEPLFMEHIGIIISVCLGVMGCVNLRPIDAEMLYNWAPIGTTVVVRINFECSFYLLKVKYFFPIFK